MGAFEASRGKPTAMMQLNTVVKARSNQAAGSKVCYYCGIAGHFANACRKKQWDKKQKRDTHQSIVNNILSPKKKIDGIRPIIENLLAQAILIKTYSPYNTLINPIRKANGSWRLTQDLRKINDIIKPLAPIVPDVHTITVIDLCSAFFSIPVDPVSQPLFAFTFDHAQLSWSRLPQGLRDSPAVFTAVVHATLADAQLPPDTCLLQYADDILVTGASADQCAAASSIVYNILAEAGFKASREKLQWVQRRVDYLGHELSQERGCRTVPCMTKS
ncbi:endogenous retrovirus group K member 8 Pol protein-like [Sinocyclocheilus grahami]|uniref:endogenous retrovirus group K member 8 Pol protein-like n=1 Tax=Sinocyclocheilus grahami TaxID=75366 RepID=UPI0007ACC2D9|nr:PREDICTED: endogenous retrovirus group K member 8 Pol protein-like [Sinocyclocheilus grahami]